MKNIKRNPFTVPEGYFAQLNAEIIAKLPEKQVELTIAKDNRKSVRQWIMSAAALALLLIGFTFWGTSYWTASAQTTDIELTDYLGFDSNDIYNYMLDS